MNAAELPDDLPPLQPGEEWVTPKDHPGHWVVVQTIPEDAPHLVREGIARRRLMTAEGVCPCGGRVLWPETNPGRGEFGRPIQQHLDECPAGPAVFVPAVEAWRLERGD